MRPVRPRFMTEQDALPHSMNVLNSAGDAHRPKEAYSLTTRRRWHIVDTDMNNQVFHMAVGEGCERSDSLGSVNK